MLMSYNAEIIRGWPYDGALERVEVIGASQTLQNGDWVTKNSDNSVSKSGATASNAVGLVIEGNGDSGSAAYSGKAVVLWGNFLARIQNFDNTATYVPGANLTVKNGVITLAGGSDPVIGFVLDVVAAGTTTTANLVIKK